MRKLLILFLMGLAFVIGFGSGGKVIDRRPADMGPPTNVEYPLEDELFYEVRGPSGIAYISKKDCTEDHEICEELEFDIDDGYKPIMVGPWSED